MTWTNDKEGWKNRVNQGKEGGQDWKEIRHFQNEGEREGSQMDRAIDKDSLREFLLRIEKDEVAELYVATEMCEQRFSLFLLAVKHYMKQVSLFVGIHKLSESFS